MDEKLKFRDLLNNRRGENHLVILPNYPDADAIAAAFAHRLISAEFGISVSIYHEGSIHPRKNLALIKLLEVEITPLDGLPDYSGIDAAILIEDSMEVSDQVLQQLEQARIPVILCHQKNHAEGNQADNLDFCKGCTRSAIYARYLEEGIMELERSRKDHTMAATALLYGILSGTDKFTHASEADFKAASFLSTYRDPELLEYIMSQARSKQIMDVIRRALGNRELIESYSIAGVGYLRAEDREAISQAADFLLTEENVHTAIVYGIMEDNQHEMLAGAIRTSKITLNPDEFLASL